MKENEYRPDNETLYESIIFAEVCVFIALIISILPW